MTLVVERIWMWEKFEDKSSIYSFIPFWPGTCLQWEREIRVFLLGSAAGGITQSLLGFSRMLVVVMGKGWLVRKGEKWRSISPLTETVTTDEEDELREADGIIRSGTQHPNLSEREWTHASDWKDALQQEGMKGGMGNLQPTMSWVLKLGTKYSITNLALWLNLSEQSSLSVL